MTLPALLLAFSSLPAMAGSCPLDMKEIDAALAENTSLSKADMGKIKGFRTSGEKMHKAGQHKKSVEALAKAKKLLDI